MRKVVTLPIKPSAQGSYLKVTTALFADFIARATSADLTIMLNSRGGSSVNTKKFLDLLKLLDIGGGVFTTKQDSSLEYDTFFYDQLRKLIDVGAVSLEHRNMLRCLCGKTDIPKEALQNAITDQKRKSLIIQEGQTLKCKLCHGTLKLAEEEVATLSLKVTTNYIVYPKNLNKETEGIQKWYADHKTVVSRTNTRERGIAGIVNNKPFFFDPDFIWSVYLGFAAGDATELYLVVGHASLIHAMRVVSLSETLFPKLHIHLIVHPVLQVVGTNTHLTNLSLSEYLETCGSVNAARAFLSLGLLWSQPKVSIASSELYFIKKMISDMRVEYRQVNRPIFDIQNIMELLNKNKLTSIYNKIRKFRTLSQEEAVLAQLILSR